MNDKILSHFGSKPVVWVAAWGLSKTRKRAGKFAGGIEGEAEWYDEWYDRFMSQQTVDKLAGLGVNLVILPFSVGGQAKTEEAERNDFERMTRMLHSRDIVSIPYIQYQNILQETFEFPDTQWGVHLDGKKKEFTYWRRTACQSSPEFIAYFKDLISDGIERGADGIWIDNTHLAPCRCDVCQQEFKQWLAEHRTDLLDTLYLDDFSRIEMPRAVAATFDPIVQSLMEFNCQRNLRVLGEMKNHLESLRPDGLFASNPGLYRGNSTSNLYGKGLDYRKVVGLHDLMYLENKFFPSRTEDQITGNYHGMIAEEACNAMAIAGGWKYSDFDSTEGTVGAHTQGFPNSAEEIRRALFEAAAFGGAISMLWAIRARPEHMCSSVDDLMSFYLEHPDIEQPTRKALAFLHSLPVFGDSRNQAEIAVLRHRESLAYNGTWSWPAVHAAEELLHQAGLPYNVLFSEDFAERASDFRMIILPEVAVLSDGDAEQIAAYVSNGGHIVVLGNGGVYNERMQTRRDFVLQPVTGVSRFKRPQEFTFTTHGKGISACLPLGGSMTTEINNTMHKGEKMLLPRWFATAEREKISAAILKLLEDKRQVIIDSPAQTTVSIRTTADGKTAVHLLAYAMHAEPTTVTLSVRNDLLSIAPAEWYVPDSAEALITPKVEQNGSHTRFSLEGFRDYGVLVV